MYGEVAVPPSVKNEVTEEGKEGAERLVSSEWLRTVPVSNQTGVLLLRERLDEGESEAIVLALELDADLLLIDEAPGRKTADARGISIAGTLGILLFAKEKGLIDKVTPVLDQLVSAGFYLSEELYQEVVRMAGET